MWLAFVSLNPIKSLVMDQGADEQIVAVDPPFPDGMPDDCPPLDCAPAEGTVYRVVKSNPPTADDFPTYVEMGKEPPAGRECECHGVSLFRERDDAEAYADKFPYLGELVAVAELEPQHGKTLSTPRMNRGVPNSHTTWWPFADVARHAPFTVLEPE